MNKYMNTDVVKHTMKLQLLGAEVKVISGKVVYVEFTINEDLEVSYVYSINKHNKYFLERIKPYPLAIREYDNDDDIIDIIMLDYLQYKDSANSNNINKFVNINRNLNKAIKTFEDLFLYYNVSEEVLNSIEHDIKNIDKTIKKASQESERLFFDKEPDNL